MYRQVPRIKCMAVSVRIIHPPVGAALETPPPSCGSPLARLRDLVLRLARCFSCPGTGRPWSADFSEGRGSRRHCVGAGLRPRVGLGRRLRPEPQAKVRLARQRALRRLGPGRSTSIAVAPAASPPLGCRMRLIASQPRNGFKRWTARCPPRRVCRACRSVRVRDPDWAASCWSLRPALGLAIDLGSDGAAGANALPWHFDANAWIWGDPAHGCQRSFDMALKRCGLMDFWILCVTTWNMECGPYLDKSRRNQVECAMNQLYASAAPHEVPLSEAFAPRITDEVESRGS